MKAKAIIVRELFVSGKTIKTYLLRLVPPVLVLGILGAFALGDDFTEMVKDGRFLFTVTLIVSLLYTILAGFFVSSCISHEREEDTIGLLFLTPLKGMDVILGKFIAAGHLHFQSVLTLLPLEALAFLLGEVPLAAFLKMNLCIFCILLFTVSSGILISSFSANERISGVITIIFLAFSIFGICILVALSGFWLREYGFFSNFYQVKIWHETLFPFTPLGIFGIFLISTFTYISPSMYQLAWGGLALLVFISILFLCIAVRIISRIWRKQTTIRGYSIRLFFMQILHKVNFGFSKYRQNIRLKLLSNNPYDWITGRGSLPTLTLWIVWSFAVIPIGYLLCLSLRPLSSFIAVLSLFLPAAELIVSSIISAPLCLISCLVLKYWLAYITCMRIHKDTVSGMLPLILSTTVTPQQIIISQIKTSFKRMILPLLFTGLIVLNYVLNYASKISLPTSYNIEMPELSNFVAIYIPVAYGIILLCADLFTLSLVSIRISLKAKNLQHAFIRSLIFVLAIPWFLLYIFFIPWFDSEQLTELGQSPYVLISLTIAALIYDAILCKIAYQGILKKIRT